MIRETELIQKFAEQLHSDISDRASGLDGQPDFRENAFFEYCLEALLDNGALEEGQACFFERKFGRSQVKVNGYGFADSGEELALMVCVYHDTDEVPTVSRHDLMVAVQRAANLHTHAAQGSGIHGPMEEASDEYAMARAIYDAREKMNRIRVFVLTDGLVQNPSLAEVATGSIPVQGEVWDLRRLYRSQGSEVSRDIIDIDFEDLVGEPIRAVQMPTRASDYTAYLAIIPANLLFEVYNRYGSRVLEYNVRSFLQATGAVNKGLRDTLRNEPEHFLAYNNGISATVDSLVPVRLASGELAIKSVRGLQIVNGGQTTASIHRARLQDKANLDGVYVQAKITVVSASALSTMVGNISKYANSQNVIQSADFSANDPYHIELEKLSRQIWMPGQQGKWFYERARGQYQVEKSRGCSTPAQKRAFNDQQPPGRKFTKTDVAKVENCWEQLPHVVSRGTQKNFLQFVQRLQPLADKGWLPDQAYYKHLIAKTIIFRAIERIVRQEKFSAYRANIVSYLMALIAARGGNKVQLDAIWSKQAVSPEFEALLRTWSHEVSKTIVATAGSRNVTEWCKKEECWKEVRALDLTGAPPAS